MTEEDLKLYRGMIEDRDNQISRLRAALEEVMGEVGSSTQAWKMADEALTQWEG